MAAVGGGAAVGPRVWSTRKSREEAMKKIADIITGVETMHLFLR